LRPQQHWPKAPEEVELAVPAALEPVELGLVPAALELVELGLVLAALEPVELALRVLATRVLAGLLPAAAAEAQVSAVIHPNRGGQASRSAVRRWLPLERLSAIHVRGRGRRRPIPSRRSACSCFTCI
jgi:hypothetical protein